MVEDLKKLDLHPGRLFEDATVSSMRHIAGIKSDQWDDATPCEEWSVRDVANHLVSETLWAAELFAGKTIDEVGDKFANDLLGDDPAGAYAASITPATEAANAHGAMERVCHLSFGDVSGWEYAWQLFIDNYIHGWDIAIATGQDSTLDPALLDAGHSAARWAREVSGGAGIIGEQQETQPGDSLQTQILALMGRRG